MKISTMFKIYLTIKAFIRFIYDNWLVIALVMELGLVFYLCKVL